MARVMADLPRITQILCTEILYVCQQTSVCEQPPDIIVYGKGMVPVGGNLTCTVGTQVVVGTYIASGHWDSVLCDFDTPGPREMTYPYPQVLPVTISATGGTFQTEIHSRSYSVLPCTGPPPSSPPMPPEPPPAPPPMSCSNTCQAVNGVCQDGAPSVLPRTASAAGS